jgi:hypothetical protein
MDLKQATPIRPSYAYRVRAGSETITLRETIEQDRICPTFPYQSFARTFEPCSFISSRIALGIYLRERSQLDLTKRFAVTTLGLSVMRFVASVMLQVFHVIKVYFAFVLFFWSFFNVYTLVMNNKTL